MKLIFRGVRGSIPVPGPLTKKYGGNTSCVQVSLDKNAPILIFDAGTGIRGLGKELAQVDSFLDIHIFITHGHWDHIQGLPYFDPLFRKNRKITFYSLKRDGYTLEFIIKTVIENRYFPHTYKDWQADISFMELENNSSFTISDNIVISTAKLNHPWIANAYRVDYDNCSMVYCTDTAPFDHVILDKDFISTAPDINVPVPKDVLNKLMSIKTDLIKLCKDADTIIYDTMFSEAEYNRNPHWGHSSPSHALEICSLANVKNLIMFHHAPERSDDAMDSFLKDAVSLGDKYGISVSAAIENSEAVLGGENP